MHPVVDIALGGLEIHTSAYRFFLALAAAFTVGVAFATATRRGLPGRRVLACLSCMAAAVPVGARLWDAATKSGVYFDDPGRLLALDLTGLSLYGGLFLAAGVGAVACRILSVDLVGLADATTPALGVGIALARLGCFEAGCCFGQPTDLPWGVTFPRGSDAHLHQLLEGGLFSGGRVLPVHPTQLYELAAALAGAGVAALLLLRKAPPGEAFLSFVMLYDGFRLVNHFLRVPGAALATPRDFYPMLYLCIFATACAVVGWRRTGPGLGRARATVHQFHY